MKEILRTYGVNSLWHFTQTSNLDLIRQHGILSRKLLIERGLIQQVQCGGDSQSHQIDVRKGNDGYAFLAFTSEHPMAYVLDQRVAGEVTWVEVDPVILSLPGVKYADRVSTSDGVRFLNPQQAAQELDFEAIFQFIDFGIPGNQQRKLDARKYEILIPNGIHPKYVGV